ncbi:MAG TPA: DUF1015 domain-containing protein [archaeon]|nr:DUF1015 domain-containing protein [archaeon]
MKIRYYEKIGLCAPRVLLPKDIDYKKWAVVACDQYTSEPEYWNSVKEIVGSNPSTLNIIFPEIYLEDEDKSERIKSIVKNMKEYVSNKLFEDYNGFVYVERKIKDKVRKGLVVALDLEKYDYRIGSTTLVRATEGTILDRLPPRIEIRKDAPLELPHIMVLIDDSKGKVINIMSENKQDFEKLYSFDLMKNGGHISGYLISKKFEKKAARALEKLIVPEKFKKRYKLEKAYSPLLYAVGDGNHSLATAKAVWEIIKKEAESKNEIMNHPARYALIELVNLHDESLEFEAIHRVLFNLKKDIIKEMKSHFEESFKFSKKSKEEVMEIIKTKKSKDKHFIGLITDNPKKTGIIKIINPKSNIPVGTIQEFLDNFGRNGGFEKIDYVHGDDVLCTLGQKPNNAGIYLPTIQKKQFFKSVIVDGALPRKTFSMGEAHEKRYYLEARKIR